MLSLKRRIEVTLKPIIGEPLSDMWRYAGFQKFEFGVPRPAVNRKGQPITRADWGLVVGGPWCITRPEGRIVSSDDFGPDGERHDAAVLPFYALIHDFPPTVLAIEVGERAQLRFVLSQGYVLSVTPAASDPDDEQWRFMPKDRRRSHLVIEGDGRAWPRRY